MQQFKLVSAAITLVCISHLVVAAPEPIRAVDSTGKPLNFSFEDGTLKD